MMRGLARLRVVLTYVGTVLLVLGTLLMVPFFLSVVFGGPDGQDVRAGTFTLPMFVALLVGSLCRYQMQRWERPCKLGRPEAMLICVLGWLAVSALGALPFSYQLGIGYLDAYFEAMSGFTTTGITMLRGLDAMPKSLLFWRSMTQWIGGLGILTFFLALVFQGGISYRLLSAESHKIGARRIAPGIWNTLRILWLIYILYTALLAGALCLCGLGIFDAVCHALTCLATGGYSTHDASIAFYEQAGFRHHAAVEYVIILGMWAGGTSFLVHYRLLKGQLRPLWGSDEMRAWWLVLGAAVAVVFASRLSVVQSGGQAPAAPESVGESFRHSLFQVISIATSTGYATRDIASSYFPHLARQVFLVLMVIGGCAGSTSGGLKVARIALLWRLMARQVRMALKPDASIDLLLMDGQRVTRQDAYGAAGLLFAWLLLLLLGGLTTAALSSYGALESASGMFSALGNTGPCYIPTAAMAELHPVVKLVYIVGMLAGRLEIMPLLVLLSSRTWR